jgi:hypothetical protein
MLAAHGSGALEEHSLEDAVALKDSNCGEVHPRRDHSVIQRVFYGPPDWIVTKFSARDRRAFGFWIIVWSIVGAIFFGGEVLYVTILSIIALIPNYTTETPTQDEDEA